MKIKRTSRYLNSCAWVLAIAAIIVTFIGTAKANPNKETPPALGTESHGGDILRARSLHLRDVLTLSEQELNEKNLSGTLKPTKFDLKKAWKGLAIAHKRLPPSSLQSLIQFMLVGDKNGNIFDDVERSKYDTKIYPSPTETDLTKPEYQDCLDYHGQAATAGAGLNDRFGTICFDTRRLTEEGASLVDLVAIASHEHAHHFGAEEDLAIELQRFITVNESVLYSVANQLEEIEASPNGLVVETSEVDRDGKIIFQVLDSKTRLPVMSSEYGFGSTNSLLGYQKNEAYVQNKADALEHVYSFSDYTYLGSLAGYVFRVQSLNAVPYSADAILQVTIVKADGTTVKQAQMPKPQLAGSDCRILIR